jgi:polar amino acid transport system ATP-binding protein
VHGQPLQADNAQSLRELRKNVGMIFQSFNLFPT